MRMNMRNAGLLVMVLLASLILGCREDLSTGISSANPLTVQSDQLRPLSIPNVLKTVELVPLPEGTGNDYSPSRTQRVTVTGGGKFSLAASYTTANGACTRTLTFTVPPYAVSSDVDITVSFDPNCVGVRFQPEGLVFKKPASLDFKTTGLKLTSVNLSFFYVNDQLLGEPMLCSSLWANPLQGSLTVNGAQIPHFSRYAFGR